jgi:hypothetical protein
MQEDDMRHKLLFITVVFALLAVLATSVVSAQDPGPLDAINAQLAAQGLNIRAEAIEYFTIGQGRPSNRVHQQEFRWVPNDPRRAAQGTDITYLVDVSNGATASGLSAAETEAAIDRSMSTWNANRCLTNVSIVKRADPGTDVTIYDSFFGYGGFGDYLAADIVNAGWYPRDYFEAAGGTGGGRGILAFSVTFIFTDDDGNPTDINGDNYIDTALNEVYFNDTFGDPNNDRVGNPWGINIQPAGIDVETVSLHENGHSLGLGHFGPPPSALMNPVYDGIKHAPLAVDSAGMCAYWRSWPR